MGTRYDLDAGNFDRRVRIERRTITRDDYGGEAVTWSTVATVWAWLRDVLLWNNGEASSPELRQLTRPTRVVIRYRDDITTDMRIVILDRSRTLQIISIAELGRGAGIEMMCEDYSTAGT